MYFKTPLSQAHPLPSLAALQEPVQFSEIVTPLGLSYMK